MRTRTFIGLSIVGTIMIFVVANIIILDAFTENPQAEKDGASSLFPPGQLVRHRMDGRIGCVIDNGNPLAVRFSCNYMSKTNFEVVRCWPFELVRITPEEERFLYWRIRERPKHGPDQTELCP